MGNILLNVPCGDNSAVDLFEQEIDMLILKHGFSKDEISEWYGYAANIPDGYWNKEDETICVFGSEYGMTEIIHNFKENEIKQWSGYDGSDFFESCWDKKQNQIYA